MGGLGEGNESVANQTALGLLLYVVSLWLDMSSHVVDKKGWLIVMTLHCSLHVCVSPLMFRCLTMCLWTRPSSTSMNSQLSSRTTGGITPPFAFIADCKSGFTLMMQSLEWYVSSHDDANGCATNLIVNCCAFQIGAEWSDVVEQIRRGHYQPLLLVYTNPFADTVDIAEVRNF